jgi:hypothetical protein
MKHGPTSLKRSEAGTKIPSRHLPALDFRFPSLALCVGSAILIANCTHAATSDANPYTGIVERNTFGLRPPVNPADLVKPAPSVSADILLQGITTILGRELVLMKVKFAARPPEPARDESLMLREGQRDGDIEVLEINPVDGSVKVNNNGTVISLTMKENSEKPTPGAAVTTAPGVRPTLPGIVPPPAPAVPQPTTAAALESFGGNKTIPTRTLRSSPVTGGVNLTPQQQIAAQRTPEETMALQLLNQAKNQQLIQSGVRMPLIRNPALNNLQK